MEGVYSPAGPIPAGVSGGRLGLRLVSPTMVRRAGWYIGLGWGLVAGVIACGEDPPVEPTDGGSEADRGTIVDATLPGDGGIEGDGAVILDGTPGDVDPGDRGPPMDLGPLDPNAQGTVTDFLRSIGPLIQGQPSLDPAALEPHRVAVVRGKVITTAGQPIASVVITQVHHPELGQTQTDAAGEYALVVNGGGDLLLRYQHPDHVTVQRTVNSPWREFVVVEDVVLTPYDVATTIQFGGANPQTAQSSLVADDDGMRVTTVYVPAGTTAELQMPDGTTTPFAGGQLRITELTVGPTGPAAMPGHLPAASAYTWAADFSFDEARAAGAAAVHFSAPIPIYLDNFLGFPVGARVPNGTYDPGRDVWVPQPDALVIGVLGVDQGRATIDLDGDSTAEDDVALLALGIDDAERVALAGLYPQGGELWRAETAHFSTLDLNSAALRRLRRRNPRFNPYRNRKPPCLKVGSIVGCEPQTWSEYVPVLGTNHQLVYHSGRAKGRGANRQITVPISGLTPNLSNVTGMRFEGQIAGQRFVQTFTPGANHTVDFRWDGKDALGQVVQGVRTLVGTVTWDYAFSYAEMQAFQEGSFGSPPSEANTALRSPRPLVAGGVSTRFVADLGGPPEPRSFGLGGLSLAVHHVFDPHHGVVHLGTGLDHHFEETVRRVAGNGGSGAPQVGPATQTPLPAASRVRALPDGSVLLSGSADRAWRLESDGTLDVEVGCASGQNCQSTVVDGTPARAVRGHLIEDLSVAPDGTRYVLLTNNSNLAKAVFRIDAAGLLERVAGRLDQAPGPAPVGGEVAKDVSFAIREFTAGPDGMIYLLIGTSRRQVLRVGPSGIIRIHAGTTTGTCFTDRRYYGGPATAACLPAGAANLAAARNGDVYFTDSADVLNVIQADGLFDRYAGLTSNCNTPAIDELRKEACLDGVRGLTIGPNDLPMLIVNDRPTQQLFIVEIGERVEARAGGAGEPLDAGPARGFGISVGGSAGGLASMPDGTLVFSALAEDGSARLWRTGTPQPSGAEWIIPAPRGRTAWVFDREGRHLATRDLLTGATVLTFGYDTQGRLSSLTDAQGRVTRIERPTADTVNITSPGGFVTALTLDANGYATRITNPAGTQATFAYDPPDATFQADHGLVSSYTDARGHSEQLTFDDQGHLARIERDDGGVMQFYRTTTTTTAGTEVSVTVEEGGRSTEYIVTPREDGAVVRTIHGPDGTTTTATLEPGGVETVVGPDGTITGTAEAPDPRFPFVRYTASKTVLKNGLVHSVATTRTVSGGSGYFGSGVMTQDSQVNGRPFRLELDAGLGELRQTTATGRTRLIRYDSQGRIVAMEGGPGVAPLRLSWNPVGELLGLTFGTRQENYTYDGRGRLQTVTTGRGSATITVDDHDRISEVNGPDGTTRYAWYPDGALESFTPPGSTAHNFDWDHHDRFIRYTPPSNGDYAAAYAADGPLLSRTLPSGRAQTLTVGGDGRPSTISYPEATVSFVSGTAPYVPATLSRTPATGHAQVITFESLQGLLSRSTYSGATTAVIDRVYGPGLQATSVGLAVGADGTNYTLTLDDDGALIGYGPIQLARGGPDRAVDRLALGAGYLEFDYTPEGWLAEKRLYVGANLVQQLTLTYDGEGVPLSEVQVLSGVTTSETFVHDGAGRLTEVDRGGAPRERYAYDPRGNRTSAEAPGSASAAATYDTQDRLLTLGAAAVTVDADGFVTAVGSDSYVYSTVGELISATSMGTTVTYDYDPTRRLVRRDEGAASTTFYYADPLDDLRPSHYRAPGEALTSLLYDDRGLLVGLERGATQWMVATDAVGTPRAVIALPSGDVVKVLEWDRYGRLLSDSNPAFVLPIGFAGGIRDPRTGLHRFGLRDYDPRTGRWMARDPIFLAGGQLNFYAYVGSHPITSRDPSGLFCVGGAAFAIVGGGGKLCISNEGVSACGELGVGVGESVDISPFGQLDNNFAGFEGGAKVGIGPFGSVGCEGSFGVDPEAWQQKPFCGYMLDGDCKVGLMGGEASLRGKGESFSPGDIYKLLETKPAPKFEWGAKLTTKLCARL